MRLEYANALLSAIRPVASVERQTFTQVLKKTFFFISAVMVWFAVGLEDTKIPYPQFLWKRQWCIR